MRIILPALAILAISGSVAAQPAAVDIAPFIAREITPKIHLLTTPDDYYAGAIGNIILIEQSDGFVEIDSGQTAANGRAVVRYARSLSSKPIKVVAITHWHNDHPLGVSAIRDAYPKVRIISTVPTEAGLLGPAVYNVGYSPSSAADTSVVKSAAGYKEQYAKLLEDPNTPADRKERIKKALVQFDAYTRDFVGTYIVPPTETFQHQLVIRDREIPVHLMFLGRANTAGDLVAWLPKQKVVASGDIVVSPYPFGFGSYSHDWIQTLGRIKALGFTTLIPGHGAPQSGTAYLDRLIAAMMDLRGQIYPLAKAGTTLDEVRKKVDFAKSIALFGDTSRDKANVQSLFFDPMIGSVYKEALGQPIVQGDRDGAPPPAYTEIPPPSRAVHHKS